MFGWRVVTEVDAIVEGHQEGVGVPGTGVSIVAHTSCVPLTVFR